MDVTLRHKYGSYFVQVGIIIFMTRLAATIIRCSRIVKNYDYKDEETMQQFE